MDSEPKEKKNPIEMTRCCDKEDPAFIVTFDGKPDKNYSQKVCRKCVKHPMYSEFVINMISVE